MPAHNPVQRISRADALAVSTVVIMTKAIVTSAANAMNSPSPAASIRYSGQCWQSTARTSTISASRREFGVEGHAAVDEQRDAVYIIAGVGGQPDGGTGDVFGLADALVRHEPHQRLIG